MWSLISSAALKSPAAMAASIFVSRTVLGPRDPCDTPARWSLIPIKPLTRRHSFSSLVLPGVVSLGLKTVLMAGESHAKVHACMHACVGGGGGGACGVCASVYAWAHVCGVCAYSVSVCMCVCMCACMCAHVHMYMCVCASVCMHACMCVCACVCAYILKLWSTMCVYVCAHLLQHLIIYCMDIIMWVLTLFYSECTQTIVCMCMQPLHLFFPHIMPETLQLLTVCLLVSYSPSKKTSRCTLGLVRR